MISDSGRRHGRVHLRRRHRHPRQVIVDEPQRVAGAERRRARGQLVQRRAQRVQVGALVHRPAGAPGLLRRQVRQRPHDLAVVRELGTDLGERRRQREVHQARRAVARRPRCSPGVMSRCITPRRCIPATARASPTASPISSSTASGFASPARLVPPTSASTIDPGYRGASTSCATPATPRSRSSIASSCRSRRCASGPSGSLRMTVRPARNSRVTRVRSLSCTSSARAGGSRFSRQHVAVLSDANTGRTALPRSSRPGP